VINSFDNLLTEVLSEGSNTNGSGLAFLGSVMLLFLLFVTCARVVVSGGDKNGEPASVVSFK